MSSENGEPVDGKARTSPENQTHRFPQRWRTVRAHKLYSLKLYEALRRYRRPTPSTVSSTAIRVRDTANIVLAVAARGKTRWSRAILASRLRASRHAKDWKTATGRRRGLRRPERRRKLPAVENRVRVLRRLVPGCRKMKGLPEILEEAADYIAALEMQVRAMKALSEILAESQPSTRLGSISG